MSLSDRWQALRLHRRYRKGQPVSLLGGSLSGGVTVTAHSGCMSLPDNSLEAMAAGIEAGAGIVEFDLNYTADGTPVLSHDKPADGSSCVTLAEAFAFLAQHKGVQANVDVKSTERLELVPPLAAQAGVMEQIFFTGVREQDVAAVREKCPGFPYYLNTSVHRGDDLKALVKKTAALGAVGLNINWKSASPKLIRAFHQKGMPVSVWTVNRAARAIEMALLGADNITSRRPDLVCRLIGSAEQNSDEAKEL